MAGFPKIFNELVEALSRFPGVGRRSAERMAFYILRMPYQEMKKLASRIEEAHRYIRPCKICNNFSVQEICSICANPKREKDVVCIVEEPKDIVALEKTSQYNGVYFCLLGAISPLEGVGAEDLNIRKLINRIERGEVKEVIISTDPDSDGELTAQFLIEKISQYNVKIYRIAIGVPLGTQIEYLDVATLGRALIDRKPLT